MSHDEGLYAWVQESLEPLGTVTLRRMMGAAVLYLDGTIFAVLDDEDLWFKVDAETEPAFVAEACEPFTFTTKEGKVESMNYRRAPAEVHDDPESMRKWARLAVAAGHRSAARKKPRRSSKPES